MFHAKYSARLIQRLSSETAAYQLEKPMKFIKPSFDAPTQCQEVIESDIVVIHSSSMQGGIDRTVIHAASCLKGDGVGFSYGAMGNRVLDGVKQHAHALEISGYLMNQHGAWGLPESEKELVMDGEAS